MLSFFASDHVEQMYGENGGIVDRKQWQAGGWKSDPYRRREEEDNFKCDQCGFGHDASPQPNSTPPQDDADHATTEIAAVAGIEPEGANDEPAEKKKEQTLFLVNLPPDILLLFCDRLDEQSLLLAARAWNGFGRLMRAYNIMRNRELQCFTFKQGYQELDLGIGVTIDHTRQGQPIASEFDILSRMAYEQHGVRQSIQGLRFDYWLPLPLAHSHWNRVRGEVDERLQAIAKAKNINGTLDNVIYAFMNDIVVRLSHTAGDYEQPRVRLFGDGEAPKSTLTHASEKAIESYFHLFHLLVCLATERNLWATRANDAIKNFLAGRCGKQDCPNLGYLLIMTLISDAEDSEELNRAIIKEAITRNVVWMLEPEPKGRGMVELSFMETSTISMYRLAKTFEASKTSYRLIMFLNLMRKVVHTVRHEKQKDGTIKKLNLAELRTALFDRHGAPPNGAAAVLAKRVQEIQKVNDFPNFLTNMGIRPPSASNFTTFLRDTVKASMDKGYSKWALTQPEALYYRQKKEPQVERPEGMRAQEPRLGRFSFFAGRGGGQGGGRGGGGRGGRGGGRGRY